MNGTDPRRDRSRPIWRDPHLILSCVLGVLVIACVAPVAPTLPAMARALGMPGASLGLVMGGFLLPGLVTAPLAGILLDRLDSGRVLVLALGWLGVFGAACALAQSGTMLIAARMLAGCAAGAISVISLTILGRRFKGKSLVAATAAFGFVQTMSTAVLPWLGGLMAQASWRAPFLLALLALPAMFYAKRILFRDQGAAEKRSRPGLMDMVRVVDRPLALVLFLEFLNFALLTGSLLTYVPVLLVSRFALEPKSIGLVVALAATVSALASLATKKLGRSLRPRLVVAAAFALYVPAYVLAPLAGSLGLFLVAAVLLGLGRGLNLPSLIRMVNEQAPDEHRGLYNGAYLFVLRAGQATGPLAAGAIFALGGIRAVFFTDAALALGAACLALALSRPLSR